MKKQKNTGLYKLALCAIFAALASLIQFIEIPLPFIIPSFIKLDFSDLPALLASFALGPVYGAAVCLIKNLVHLTTSYSAGIGELANFLVAVGFVVPAGIIYRKRHTKKGAVIGAVTGSVIAAICSFPVNLFITYPFYAKIMPIDSILAAYNSIWNVSAELWQALLIFNAPFTLVKCLLVTLITAVIYKPLSPFFHRFTSNGN